MAWILLFVTQPLLIRWTSVRWHRRIGMIGLPLAGAVAVTIIPAGLVQISREVAAGGGETAISSIVGMFTSGALFVALVAAGIITRQDREAHARWLHISGRGTEGNQCRERN